MSGLGIEPPPEYAFPRGKNVPTFAPDSYEGLRRRPQFFPQQSGALIRNEPQAGRGSIFHGRSIAWGSIPIDWRPPTVLPRRVCRLGTRSVESLLAEIFAPMGVRTPAGVFQSVSVCRLS